MPSIAHAQYRQKLIDDNVTPELAVAVVPECRGRGIGTKLLVQLVETAEDLFSAVCLSVRADNPAVRLYQRIGFVRVEGSEVINREGGVSFSMVSRFGGKSVVKYSPFSKLTSCSVGSRS